MCNHEVERRQAWRESDGFAKASDGNNVGKAAIRDFNEILKGPGEPMGMLTGGPAESPLVRYHAVAYPRSPLFIQIALGFHTQIDYQPTPYPAQREICEQMVKLGLLRQDPVDGASIMHYVPVPEALRVYVDALCSVPVPVKRWVMP